MKIVSRVGGDIAVLVIAVAAARLLFCGLIFAWDQDGLAAIRPTR